MEIILKIIINIQVIKKSWQVWIFFIIKFVNILMNLLWFIYDGNKDILDHPMALNHVEDFACWGFSD